MWLAVILVLTILFLLYKCWVSTYSYWEQKGIPHVPGKFPFGSDVNFITLRRFQGYMLTEMYHKFPSDPYFGVYFLRRPVLIVKDPEIIQYILVKEFSSFKDRIFAKIPESDQLSQHLVNLDGDRWHALRNKMSPTFTSGRMKTMFPLFIKCSELFDKLLQSHVDSTIDVKDLASRFTTDVICNCAFGLETDAMSKENSDFVELGKNILDVNFKVLLAFFLISVFPSMAERLPFRFSPEREESQLYVYRLVKETVRQREEKGITRNDFLDLMIQLKNKGSLEEESKEDAEENDVLFEMNMERLAAQCFVFFVAGYESSSSLTTFCLYELALNPTIQKKVQKEIDEMMQLHAGITYDAVKEMTYLDMVVAETVRKYPSIPILSRMCTKSVAMPNGDTIERGQLIFIPIWALHYDPQYFPEPEKFDPERFSPENKESINPFAYLPFGEGPRFCIGKRFGLLQTKMGLITILRKYSVEKCDSTEAPPIKIGKAPLTTPAAPIKLKLVKRE